MLDQIGLQVRADLMPTSHRHSVADKPAGMLPYPGFLRFEVTGLGAMGSMPSSKVEHLTDLNPFCIQAYCDCRPDPSIPKAP